MNRIKKTFLCLLMTTTFWIGIAPAAENAEKDAVVLYFNGSSWNSLSEIDPSGAPVLKKYLVRGIYEGAFAMDPQNALTQLNPTTSYTDMAARVDRFYSQAQNLKTPLSYALMMISKEMTSANNGPRKLVSLENA